MLDAATACGERTQRPQVAPKAERRDSKGRGADVTRETHPVCLAGSYVGLRATSYSTIYWSGIAASQELKIPPHPNEVLVVSHHSPERAGSGYSYYSKEHPSSMSS